MPTDGRPRTCVLHIVLHRCPTPQAAQALATQLRQQHPGDYVSCVPEPSGKGTPENEPMREVRTPA